MPIIKLIINLLIEPHQEINEYASYLRPLICHEFINEFIYAPEVIGQGPANLAQYLPVRKTKHFVIHSQNAILSYLQEIYKIMFDLFRRANRYSSLPNKR